MITSTLALMMGVASTFEIASTAATVRNDYDYIGKNITCEVAQYCAMQSELYAATIADDLTLAPRYVINDGNTDVVYNETQINMTLTMTNDPAITAWSPGNNLLVTLNVYQNGLMQVKISNPAETWSRFRISDYNVGVEWGQLIPQTFQADGSGDYTMTV